MPVLEIITIGTELLLGEIQDTNSTYIARTLRDYGIDIYRLTTIGDNASRIASAIQEALERSDIIITTGGLGPTVDDPTRQAVADAVGQKLIFNEDLWQQILERFKLHGRSPTENNRRQAYIPEKAIPIKNPVGTAPCFIVEVGDASIIALPGVPSEMKTILKTSIIPFLHQKYKLESQIIKATVLHAASLGESAIDERIEDLEALANPTVGLLAHPGQVDIRVTVKAASEKEALELIQPVVSELYDRLGDSIYGEDDETLESVIHAMVDEAGLTLEVIEAGLEGTLIERLSRIPSEQIHYQRKKESPDHWDDFSQTIIDHHRSSGSTFTFGAALKENERVTAHFVFVEGDNCESATRSYGGPSDHAHLWAQNTGLDFLRRQLVTLTKPNQPGEK